MNLDRGRAQSYDPLLPALVLDGKRFEPSPFTFTRQMGFALPPVNC
ncbi:hypothetical protein [Solimonas sp. SE-A11]|nr:hypothetical protein [Solimonas sp. SE-A11]MDM4771758.1 hypothetical protein [Solimonas sp. SE-A11]